MARISDFPHGLNSGSGVDSQWSEHLAAEQWDATPRTLGTNCDTTKNPAATTANDGRTQYDVLVKQSDQQGDPAHAIPALTNLVRALESGKVTGANGVEHQLTADERLHAHQLALGLIQSMEARSLVRQNYALYLKAVEKYADAETQLVDAKTTADAIPYDLVRTEQTLLQRDSQNSELDPSSQQALLSGSAQLSNLGQWKMIVRYLLANFYLGGGVDENGHPNIDAVAGPNGVIKAHTQVLQPQKAEAVLRDIAAIQAADGKDVITNPTLDPTFAGLWNLTKINAPDALKKEMEGQTSHAHALWSRAVSAVAGIVATAIIAKYMGIASAKEFLSVGGALAIGGGFATATTTDYGMEHLVFGEKDFSLGQAALQGGGTYLVVESAMLAQNLVLEARTATITPDVTGQQVFDAMPDKSLRGLANLFDAHKIAKPDALVDALDAAGGMENAGSTMLTSEQVTALVSRSGLDGAAVMQAVVPQATAPAGGAMDTTVTATGDAADATAAATGAANHPSLLSRLYDKMPHPIETTRSIVADMHNPEAVYNPFRALNPSHVPSWGELKALRLSAAASGALTYQVGMDVENGLISQSQGEVDAAGNHIGPISTLMSDINSGSFATDTLRNTTIFYLFTGPDIEKPSDDSGKQVIDWVESQTNSAAGRLARQTSISGLKTAGRIAWGRRVAKWLESEVRDATGVAPETALPTLSDIGRTAMVPLLTSSLSDVTRAIQYQNAANRYQFLIDLENQPIQNTQNPPQR